MKIFFYKDTHQILLHKNSSLEISKRYFRVKFNSALI